MKSNLFSSFVFVLVLCAGMILAPQAFAAPQLVKWGSGMYPPGTIVVVERERKLYLVYDATRAIRYPVAVAKNGREWSGWTSVDRVDVNPVWYVPAVVRRDNPSLGAYVPGGHPGNPLGSRAIMLNRQVVDLPGHPPATVAIHGTTQAMRKTIGGKASYGCVRMYNEDVEDLASRIGPGTPVLMIR